MTLLENSSEFQYDPTLRFTVISTSAGQGLVCQQNGKISAITSKYNPTQQYQRMIDSAKLTKQKIVFIFGLSGSFLLDLVLKISPQTEKVVIIHPDTQIKTAFNLSIQNNKIEWMLGSFDVIFISLERIIMEYAEAIILKNFVTIFDTSITPFYKDYFNKIYRFFSEQIEVQQTSTFTDMKVGGLILHNAFRNLNRYVEAPGAITWKNFYKNKPIIVIAAGPSLSESVALINNFKEKAVIIAVDTVLSYLKENHIKPDFVVTCDPTPENLDHFKNNWEFIQDIPIILLGLSDPELFKYRSHHLFFYQYGNLFNWAGSAFGKKGEPEIPPLNVGFLGINFAFMLGGAPILLAGFDLAFQKEKFYVETLSKKNIEKKGDILIKTNLDGSKVYSKIIQKDDVITTDILNSYKSFLGQYRKLFKNRIYNLSQNGLDLDSISKITKEDTEQIFNQIKALKRSSINVYKGCSTQTKARKALSRLKTILINYEQLSDTSLELIDQFKPEMANALQENFEKLKENEPINQILNPLLSKELFIIQRIQVSSENNISTELMRLRMVFESVRAVVRQILSWMERYSVC